MNIKDSWICNRFIAHRGLHDEESPENSLSAYQKAIDKGYPIELDVRAIADGTFVIFHDDTLGRMTGADGFINNYTYDDIKDLTLGSSKEHIPTLDEALALINGQVPVLIEIKNYGRKVSFEKNLLKVLNKYKGEFAIQSFNPYSLEWFKINAPHITRGQLSCFFKSDDTKDYNVGFIKRFILKRMLLNKKVSEPHFISYQVENIPNRFVKKYKDLPLLAWVVSDQATYNRVKKYVDNIIFEGFIPEDK